MAKKSSKDRLPFGDKAFWKWHQRACEATSRRDAIGNDVRDFVAAMEKKYAEDGFDPRRDISWYLEQIGSSLRGEVDREELAQRRAQARKLG